MDGRVRFYQCEEEEESEDVKYEDVNVKVQMICVLENSIGIGTVPGMVQMLDQGLVSAVRPALLSWLCFAAASVGLYSFQYFASIAVHS